MRTSCLALLVSWFALAASTLGAGTREILNFNPAWKFLKADPAGAEAPDFDDRDWSTVSAPHTFNDTDTFDDWSLPGHRGEQNQWSGRTWYRKTFDAASAWRGRKVFIEFEAVRQVAEVYLNGVKLGTAKSGFTPFGFDLTPHLKFDRPNVLAVSVDNRFMKDPLVSAAAANEKPLTLAQITEKLTESIPARLEDLQADQIPWNNPHWHPAHGGIYRNVRLIVTAPLHIELPLHSFLQTEGPYAYATRIDAKSAEIAVDVPLRNEGPDSVDAELCLEVFDNDGRLALSDSNGFSLKAGSGARLALRGVMENPRLWEPGYPHAYRAVLTISVQGQFVDAAEISLGLRAIRWEASSGLWINGSHYKLHGWGQKSTNEWPGLGAALPDWMQFYTAQLMKDAGGNFLRWGHVPGGPAQIAAADRLGIVTLQPGVDGEHDTVGGAWALRVATFRDLLIYYRNHPSIFIWEGGNQKVSRDHAAELRALMDKYDPHGGRAYAHRRADQITAEFMDVGIGTEGGREIARLPVVEGEYNREESPRRVWDAASPPGFGYPEAKGQTYQLTSEQFAVNQIAQYVNKLGAPGHAGGANWMFSDGTSGGRVSVEVARASGEVDGVRLPKEAYFVCQVMFTYEPRVHIIGHWSYPAGTRKTVYVAANTGGEVELFLNNRSLGRARPENRFLYTFPDIAFEPGVLKAVAYKESQPAAVAEKQTAGAPVALRLSRVGGRELRADGADIALFDVEALDARGARVPTFQQPVDFELAGPGLWRGGYNSGKINSTNHPSLELEAGINRVTVRSTFTPGSLTLRARSAGLDPAVITFSSGPVEMANGAAMADAALPSFPLPPAPVRQPAGLAPQAVAPLMAPKKGEAGRHVLNLTTRVPVRRPCTWKRARKTEKISTWTGILSSRTCRRRWRVRTG